MMAEGRRTIVLAKIAEKLGMVPFWVDAYKDDTDKVEALAKIGENAIQPLLICAAEQITELDRLYNQK
jgi:hypothetical protein